MTKSATLEYGEIIRSGQQGYPDILMVRGREWQVGGWKVQPAGIDHDGNIGGGDGLRF